MKKMTVFLCLIISMAVSAQNKGNYYVFDENWKAAKIEHAKFLLHNYQLSDTCWQWDYYNFVGPLLRTEQTRDADGNEMNGVCYHYNQKGFVDSISNFYRGRREGITWKLSGDTMKHEIKYIYRNDTLVGTYSAADLEKDEPIPYKDEKESEFPGGYAGWARYLGKNIKYPERAINGNIQGQVKVFFVVDKSGNVITPFISGSVEYSLDEEAIRIIKGSGRWSPAFENGKFVKSYKQQPINFSLE